MSYENHYQQGNNKNGVYSKRLRAGKRRTYFFDVRTTRANDYFLTITESKRRFDGNGYERHKIFLYKEDFNKFRDALEEVTDYVKTELLPDFDFDQFSHEEKEQEEPASSQESVNQESSENSEKEEPVKDEVETEQTKEATTETQEENAPSIDEKVEKW